MIKGILTTVLRFSLGDCTNNGLSSKKNSLILVGPGIAEKFEVPTGEDYLILKEFNFRGEISLRAVPASLIASDKIYMFGGNYCVCSKENGNVTDHPIKIFDRVESQVEYNSHSI